MRPMPQSERNTSTPDLRLVDSSCSRSGSGISSMLPDIDLGDGRWLAVTCIFERASFSDSASTLSPVTATSLMIDVPIRMRSPSLRSTLRIFSPLTKVPLVEPMSWMDTPFSSVVILACLRETMSSTRTMSRSDERPTTISRLGRSGNSPPWYLPEMKRSVHMTVSVRAVPPSVGSSSGSLVRLTNA